MKIGTPELKTKPATKYFDGGYVRFFTVDRELFYEVFSVTKTTLSSLDGGKVLNKEHLDQLLSIKSLKECTTWL